MGATQIYRLYGLDEEGQRHTAEWVQAGSDEAGVAFARAMKKGMTCQLWPQDRLVAEIGALKG